MRLVGLLKQVKRDLLKAPIDHNISRGFHLRDSRALQRGMYYCDWLNFDVQPVTLIRSPRDPIERLMC